MIQSEWARINRKDKSDIEKQKDNLEELNDIVKYI